MTRSPLDLLLPEPEPAPDTWRWGTVTQASPLRVRLDGDAEALAVTPDALSVGLTPGARVYCQLIGRRIVVLGVRRGWSAYTPALDGLTLGNGTATARWARVDTTVHAAGQITLGSTSSVTGNITVSLPTALAGAHTSGLMALGQAMAFRSGVGLEVVFPNVASSNAFILRRASGGAIGPGVPWAWGAGDVVTWNVTYETA